MENRKRTQTLTIRLTELEKTAIHGKAKREKMSLTDFVVAACLRTEQGAAAKVTPLLVQMGRIGSSLARIAARPDSDIVPSEDLQDIIDLQRDLYRELCQIARSA